MKMSNPVFSSIDNIDWHRSLRQSNTGTVTMDDVIQKTSITLGIIVASAAANFALAWVVPPLASLLSLIGAIGALVMVLVSTFGNKFESAGVTIPDPFYLRTQSASSRHRLAFPRSPRTLPYPFPCPSIAPFHSTSPETVAYFPAH